MNDAVATPKDRSTGLVVFGVIQVLLGGLIALMIPLTLVGSVLAPKQPAEAAAPGLRLLLPGLLLYVLLAAWLVTMGIGSIRARRWARALTLVGSWFWLVCGALGLVFLALFLPGMYGRMGADGQLPQPVMAIVMGVTVGFSLLVYVVIPGALVLFYGSRHTRATCERRDPRARWTDRCPLPVLALSLMAASWATWMPAMGLYGWTLPFFGTVLDGAAGAAVALTSAALLGWAAWGLYTLRRAAWWTALLLCLAWGFSSALTFARVDLLTFYARMRMPEAQLAAMRQMQLPPNHTMVLVAGSWLVVAVAFLLVVRRHFKERDNP